MVARDLVKEFERRVKIMMERAKKIEEEEVKTELDKEEI